MAGTVSYAKSKRSIRMDEFSTRKKQIMDENLSVDDLVHRLVAMEMEVKMAETKVEEGQLYVALQAVDLQKSSDPSYIDVDSDEYNDAYNSRYLFLFSFLVADFLSNLEVLTIRTFFRKTTAIANQYGMKNLKSILGNAIGNTAKADEAFEAGSITVFKCLVSNFPF